MLEKVRLDTFKVEVSGTWTCPNCGTVNRFLYSHGPYTAPAADPHDDQCTGCKEFYTVNYYDD